MIVTDPRLLNEAAMSGYAAAAAVYGHHVDVDEAYAEIEAEMEQRAKTKPNFGTWTCEACQVRGDYSTDPVCWCCGKDPWEQDDADAA